jgi:hypothetical protein
LVVAAHVAWDELGLGTERPELICQRSPLLLVPSRDDEQGALAGYASAVALPMPVSAPVMMRTHCLPESRVVMTVLSEPFPESNLYGV